MQTSQTLKPVSILHLETVFKLINYLFIVITVFIIILQ